MENCFINFVYGQEFEQVTGRPYRLDGILNGLIWQSVCHTCSEIKEEGYIYE